MIHIKLPWLKFSERGGNKKGNWSSHLKSNDNEKNTGYVLAKNLDFKKREVTKLNGYRVRVVLKPPINRYPDWDNAGNAVKYYQDGICQALGIDDNEISHASIERGLPIKQGEIWYFIE